MTERLEAGEPQSNSLSDRGGAQHPGAEPPRRRVAAMTWRMAPPSCSRRSSTSRWLPPAHWLSFHRRAEQDRRRRARTALRKPATSASPTRPGRAARRHRGVLQAYLAWGEAINRLHRSDQPERHRQDARASRSPTSPSTPPLPPTTLLSNPAALRQFLDTGGESLWRGFNNYLGRPCQERRDAGAGRQVAVQGRRQHRDHARRGRLPQRSARADPVRAEHRPRCRKRPLVVTPPQINKYYSLDLSPDKSLVQFLVEAGPAGLLRQLAQPDRGNSATGASTRYVAALDEATDAVREITGSDDVTMVAAPAPAASRRGRLRGLAGRQG